MARARRRRKPILVPTVVAGEAYTKLRCDKRVSPRRDAGPALALLAMIDSSPDAFALVAAPDGAHARANQLLQLYSDQLFSYVDAVVFVSVESDASIDTVLTVDARDFQAFPFSRVVAVDAP